MASKAVIDTLIAEAGGEGEAGIVAAAWAIQQRAAARGQTTDEVVRSGFDGFSKPGSEAVKSQANPAVRARVERIMSGVESGSIPNPVPGADHFVSGSSSPSWTKSMKLVATVGGHRFYASGNVPDSAQGGSVGTELSVRQAPVPNAVPGSVTARRNQVTPVSRTASVSKMKAGDDLALSPVRGATPTDMDASYDREQGVMRLKPSPVGEMPTLDATRASFGLAPMARKPQPVAAPSASDLARGKSAPADPAYAAKGNPFKPGATKPDPAYSAPGNPLGRAPLVVTPPNQPAGSVLGKAADRLVSPGGLTTKAVEVENPAYASMLRQVEAGTLIDSKGLSRDALAKAKAGAATAAAMAKAKLATIPKTITVQQQVRTPVTQRAPVVAAKPSAPAVIARTAVDQLRSQGYSPSAAYAKANADAAARALAGSKYAGSSSGGRAGQSLSQSGGERSFMER